MNFREHVEFRGPGILDCKMFSLGRQFAGANGLTDSIRNFFVLRLCRVLINLMVKRSSDSCLYASSKYKSRSQTTTAPPLSAGLITMSVRFRSDLSALSSSCVRFWFLMRFRKSSWPIFVRQRWI